MVKFRMHDLNGGSANGTRAPTTAGGRGAALSGVQTRVLDAFTRGVDALEANIGRAPADIQPRARQAVAVARQRPWLTMAGLAAVGLVLARSGRRRR